MVQVSNDMGTYLVIESALKTGFGVGQGQADFEDDSWLVVEHWCAGQALSRKLNLYIVLEPNLLEVGVDRLCNLLFCQYRLLSFLKSITDQNLMRQFFIVSVHFLDFCSHDSLVLEVRIVLFVLFKKEWHLFVVVCGKEIFQLWTFIGCFFGLLLLGLSGIGEKLVLDGGLFVG